MRKKKKKEKQKTRKRRSRRKKERTKERRTTIKTQQRQPTAAAPSTTATTCMPHTGRDGGCRLVGALAGGGGWLLGTAVLHEACPQSVHCAVPLPSHLQQLLLLKRSEGRVKGTLPRVKGTLPKVKGTGQGHTTEGQGHTAEHRFEGCRTPEFKINTQGS